MTFDVSKNNVHNQEKRSELKVAVGEIVRLLFNVTILESFDTVVSTVDPTMHSSA